MAVPVARAGEMIARLDEFGCVVEAVPGWDWPDGDGSGPDDTTSLLGLWDAAAPTDPVSAAMASALRRALAGELPGPRRFLKACPGRGSGWWEVTVWQDEDHGHTMVKVVDSDLFIDDAAFPGAVALAMTRARLHRERLLAGTLHRLAAHDLFSITLHLESLAMGSDPFRSRRLHDLVTEIDHVIGELRHVALTVDAMGTSANLLDHRP